MIHTVLRIFTINGAAPWDDARVGRYSLSCFHRTIVVPEPYQAGVLPGSWCDQMPLERQMGEPGFRTRLVEFVGGVRTW